MSAAAAAERPRPAPAFAFDKASHSHLKWGGVIQITVNMQGSTVILRLGSWPSGAFVAIAQNDGKSAACS